MKHTKMISRRSFLQAAASAAALSALALTGCSSSSGASSAAGGSSAASASGTVYKVGIVNYVDDASLNQIVASVEARLDEVGAERGVTFNYQDYYSNAQADQSNLNQIGADLVADDVDVIVAVATPTASTMLAAVAGQHHRHLRCPGHRFHHEPDRGGQPRHHPDWPAV